MLLGHSRLLYRLLEILWASWLIFNSTAVFFIFEYIMSHIGSYRRCGHSGACRPCVAEHRLWDLLAACASEARERVQ